ncbi:Uncharacterized protein HZ326_20478 [Fusarium oxysporum f. sp. albedinis]|nr:Uncharacterized protein HZ326_20478 [Fusarium oxysporum f. sp. albedinis]
MLRKIYPKEETYSQLLAIVKIRLSLHIGRLFVALNGSYLVRYRGGISFSESTSECALVTALIHAGRGYVLISISSSMSWRYQFNTCVDGALRLAILLYAKLRECIKTRFCHTSCLAFKPDNTTIPNPLVILRQPVLGLNHARRLIHWTNVVAAVMVEDVAVQKDLAVRAAMVLLVSAPSPPSPTGVIMPVVQ